MILMVKNLSKVYKSGTGVRNIDFSVEKGEILAILGPNGAGKTTTLKCIIGLRKPNSGSIVLSGKYSYLPEEKNLYRWATVSQMLKIAENYTKDFDFEKAQRILGDLRIPLHEKVANLSHGQLTSLYLSITLAQNADLYVLDEPTWGLDPLSRSYILDEIRKIPLDEKSVLYTSHIVEEVEKTADRVIILKSGVLVEKGVIDEIKERYVAIRVKKGERMRGFLYKETDEEDVYIVKKDGNSGTNYEPASFSMIVEAMMRGEIG